MGGPPPHFEGKNFAYWKVRMAAYLDAIAPEVWLATKTGWQGGVRGQQSADLIAAVQIKMRAVLVAPI